MPISLPNSLFVTSLIKSFKNFARCRNGTQTGEKACTAQNWMYAHIATISFVCYVFEHQCCWISPIFLFPRAFNANGFFLFSLLPLLLLLLRLSFFFAIVCVLTSQWRHSHQVTGLVFSCYFVSIMIRIVHFSSWVFCSHNEFSYVLCCTLSPYTYIWFVNGITYSLHSACSSVLFSSPRLENDFVSIFSKGVNNSFFPTFQNEVEKLIPYLNLAKLLILVME